jgi:hypothetical protein
MAAQARLGHHISDSSASGNARQHNGDVVTNLNISFSKPHNSRHILDRLSNYISDNPDRTVLGEAQESAASIRSSCPRSTEEQRVLCMAINSLYLAIRDINGEVDSTEIDQNEIERLNGLTTSCRAVLAELDNYITRYERWGTQTQRAVNRSGLGSEEVNQISQQVQNNANALIDFKETMGR